MTPTAVIEQVEEKALSVPDQARLVVIKTNDDYISADNVLTAWRQIENEVHSAFDPIVESAHKAHKEAVSQRKKYLDPIEQGRAILKPKMAEWQWEQERIRQEAERKAQEAARKAAEESALQAALAAEQAGEKEVAEAIMAEPVAAPTVVIAKTTPKVATTFRTVWFAEVTDLKALCKAIAEGKQPIALIEPNMVALNKMATALKSNMAIPGIVARSKTV